MAVAVGMVFVLMMNVYALMAGLVKYVTQVHVHECTIQCNYCITIAICSPECLMGNCTEPDTCTCDPGWMGQMCNTGE